ncbi:MAG: nucleotidyltransferase domain-containing protein [Chrysiogenetes bacterium]|nr:nucleotidyltransferase domain-containing protein [Chrysiogenetes bacterium]
MIAEIENKRAEIEALCRRYHVKSLEVFGSAARGEDFDPEKSDIDFLVDFDRSTPSELARKFVGLLVDLQELLGRKIDLVMPNILEDRYLRETIEECREPLYAA